MEKIKFLQEEYLDLPAGTPLVEVKKSPSHCQATTYYNVLGRPPVTDIPESMVTDMHPQDPRLVGPFVFGKFKEVGVDKLPDTYFAYASVEYVYPYAHINLCVNTEVGGNKLRVSLPKHVVIVLIPFQAGQGLRALSLNSPLKSKSYEKTYH